MIAHMTNLTGEYQNPTSGVPSEMRLLPLYGAGFGNLGREGKPIVVPVPHPSPDELLCRHDAVGLCGSDYNVIRIGQEHANIYRDMRTQPVVLGHEVALTVVEVGKNLRGKYRVGERYVIQPDISVGGVKYAYGYELQGGLSQFNILDRRVLDGDAGCYLLPLEPGTGYSEAALTEPWACVEAAYRLQYRTGWKKGGSVLVAGRGYAAGWEGWYPAQVCLHDVSSLMDKRFRGWAAGRGIEVREDAGQGRFDDILILSCDPDLIEAMASRLNNGGVLGIVADKPVSRPVVVDISRLHYDRITIIGTQEPDARAAYCDIPSGLREGGAMWALGASGPSGWMHLVRAIDMRPRPRLVVATNLRSARLEHVMASLRNTAVARNVDLQFLTQQQLGIDAFLERLWDSTKGHGFDNIVVLASSAQAFSMAYDFLNRGGVLNLYAGIPRGTAVSVDVNNIIQRGVRLIGSSGSSMADMRRVLQRTTDQVISTNQWVSAIGSLDAAVDGLRAVSEGRFPGKVVIFPQIASLPLTPLPELKERLPRVHARLQDGRTWTVEAERELLRAARSATNGLE